jgi:hypothetical protein
MIDTRYEVVNGPRLILEFGIDPNYQRLAQDHDLQHLQPFLGFQILFGRGPAIHQALPNDRIYQPPRSPNQLPQLPREE